ncbi:MAG: ribosome maturation factor RimP [Candidatus Latescibacterota bacterium]|jgi:ribosome maturation factor RimP|nr:ribosome maturation factor RimP [Candidatus Latescibacterota bacterium]
MGSELARGAEPGNEAERLRERVLRFAAPVVEDHGGELVDVEVASGRGQHTVRLFVHSDKGVTVRLCAGISRELSDLLDVEDPIPGRYRLEVTSPGLDRPLCSDGDFRRAQGRKLKIVLSDGRTETGRLADWNEERIGLEGDHGEQRAVLRESIAKATIEVEF